MTLGRTSDDYRRLAAFVLARRAAKDWRQRDLWERLDDTGVPWVSEKTMEHVETGTWPGKEGPRARTLDRLNAALCVASGTVESVLAGTGQPDPDGPLVPPVSVDNAARRVGTFMRRRRRAMGWTQEEVAERLDPSGDPWVDTRLLAAMEQGRSRNVSGRPTERSLRRVSMALRLAPDTLSLVWASADHGFDPAAPPTTKARVTKPARARRVAVEQTPPPARDAVV